MCKIMSNSAQDTTNGQNTYLISQKQELLIYVTVEMPKTTAK